MFYIFKWVVHFVAFYVKTGGDVILLHSQMMLLIFFFLYLIYLLFRLHPLYNMTSLFFMFKIFSQFQKIRFFIFSSHNSFQLKPMFWKTRSRSTFDFCKMNYVIRYSKFTDKQTFFKLFFYSYL